jgi:hypothetical protein
VRSCRILRDIQFGSHGQHCDYDLYRAFDGSDRYDYGNIHQQSCGE